VTARNAARFLIPAILAVLLFALWSSQQASGPMEPAVALSDDDLDAKLAALGYADWTDPTAASAEDSGVTVHDLARASEGYNLFNSRLRREALLLDMQGEVVHRWMPTGLEGTWHHVELAPNGDLLVIAKDGYLARLDWQGRVLWKQDMRAHHDVALGGSGEVYVLSRDLREVGSPAGPVPIVDDLVVVLGADGTIRRKVSIHDLFAGYLAPGTLEKVAEALHAESEPKRQADLKLNDIYHTNTLEWIDRHVPGLAERGDLLVCVKRLDLIAVIDLEALRVRWSWGPGVLDQPHQPALTRADRILVFDNGTRRGWSRVLELDPQSQEVVWEYVAEPREAFFSETRGGSHRLRNDNVLVTESNRGRVFEITRDGDIVWEFYNPNRRERPDGTGTQRLAIYRMTRVEPKFLAGIPSFRGAHP
jgi:hypothetical protein